MSTISSLNTDQARFNPETQFKSPRDLAAAVGLTRGQKLAGLRRWEQKVADQLRASDEGMPTNDRAAADAELLREIGEVVEDLERRRD